MFGDNQILGQKLVSVDLKGRIILPKFTYADVGDKLEIVIDNNNILRLYNLKMLIERINRLNMEGYSAETIEKIMNELNTIYNSCIDSTCVDKQRRALIPLDIAQERNIAGKPAYILGAGDHIRIYGNKEEFKSHTMKKIL